MLATAVFMGLHFGVLLYGTIGQAYGFCLLLMVAAFHLALRSIDRADLAAPFGTGLCAGAVMASTLLTAPVGPILWLKNRHRSACDRISEYITVRDGGSIALTVPTLQLVRCHVFPRRSSPWFCEVQLTLCRLHSPAPHHRS